MICKLIIYGFKIQKCFWRLWHFVSLPAAHLWWLFFNDKGTFDKLVQENVETVRQLGKNVHTRLLIGNVQTLMDHLELANLLSIYPDYFCQVFTPTEKQRALLQCCRDWWQVTDRSPISHPDTDHFHHCAKSAIQKCFKVKDQWGVVTGLLAMHENVMIIE